MKVQNIGQNNYNYQNTQKQPEFKANIFGYVKFPDGNKSYWMQDRLRRAFISLITKTGSIDPSNIFANRAFHFRGEEIDQGYLILVDRTSDFVRSALGKLPADLEAKYKQPGYRKQCSDLVFDAAFNDPKTVRCGVHIDTLKLIDSAPQNLSIKDNMVPLWFPF